MHRVASLILAAGKSQRMGSPKCLLRIHGKTFLEHIVSEARHSHLIDVKIILGYQAEEIMEKLSELRPDVIINREYQKGQLSSLIKGLRFYEGSAIDGMMIFLVDHPFVSHDLINRLIEGFSNLDASIVIPTFQNRRGHPILFRHDLFSELLSAPLDQGAAAVVRKYQERILHVETLEEGILIDIDTPEAYQEYVVHKGIAS